METQELKQLIKDTIREVLREERLLLCNMLIPYVSDDEQEEIESKLGLPQDYQTEELIEMTDWLKNEHQIS